MKACLQLVVGLSGLLVSATHALAAGDGPPPPPLTCSFTAGNAGTYTAGAFTRTTAEPLSFDIDAIDLDAQTAKLSVAGKAGGKPLMAVRALNAIHVLEIAQEGFLNVTTVYDPETATGVRPAVHSRHFGLLGEPIFAQYTGFCAPK
jgi:hypothetical protein